jgi:hypothetical protein
MVVRPHALPRIGSAGFALSPVYPRFRLRKFGPYNARDAIAKMDATMALIEEGQWVRSERKSAVEPQPVHMA